jgi:hypothetical protein
MQCGKMSVRRTISQSRQDIENKGPEEAIFLHQSRQHTENKSVKTSMKIGI